MSESAIADFVAKFDATNISARDPIKGRVLLSPKRLVLAADSENKLTIPLSSIFDVAVGHVPEELDGFFDATVAVRFQRKNRWDVAVVEAGEDKTERFSTLLFKALLNGTQVTIQHPARVGGRVVDGEFQPAKLTVEPRHIRFGLADSAVEVDLAAVTAFDRSTREIAGSKRPTLQVRHTRGDRSLSTIVAASSDQKMAILDRFLRLEYSELLADARGMDVSPDETKVLVALYSGAGAEGLSLTAILGEDSSRMTVIVNRLAEKGLLADAEEGMALTPLGRVVVDTHFEDVDE